MHCVQQKEALEEALAEERKAAKAKDARHKLTVERLRRQVVELQVSGWPPLLQVACSLC